MKKVYHLSSCTTCQRIIRDIDPDKAFTYQDIKTKSITKSQLEVMAQLAGSYEALFSRKARKFRTLGLHQQILAENDYRDLILSEYTFLKRPVFIVGKNIFIGNSRKIIDALASHLRS